MTWVWLCFKLCITSFSYEGGDFFHDVHEGSVMGDVQDELQLGAAANNLGNS